MTPTRTTTTTRISPSPTTIASSTNNEDYTKYGNRCGSLDENLIPQSPKIIYSSYSCDCKNCDSMAGASCSKKTILKGYFEQKSPKYLKSYSHQSPRKSPNTQRQFIFDAVSPKEESSGKFNIIFFFFFSHKELKYIARFVC